MKTTLLVVGAIIVALATPWACIMGIDLRNAHEEHVLFAACNARLAAAGIDPRNPDRVVPGGLDTYCGPIFRAATHSDEPAGVTCTIVAVEVVCFQARVNPRAGWMVDSCTSAVEKSCLTVFPTFAWD